MRNGEGVNFGGSDPRKDGAALPESPQFTPLRRQQNSVVYYRVCLGTLRSILAATRSECRLPRSLPDSPMRELIADREVTRLGESVFRRAHQR